MNSLRTLPLTQCPFSLFHQTRSSKLLKNWRSLTTVVLMILTLALLVNSSHWSPTLSALWSIVLCQREEYRMSWNWPKWFLCINLVIWTRSAITDPFQICHIFLKFSKRPYIVELKVSCQGIFFSITNNSDFEKITQHICLCCYFIPKSLWSGVSSPLVCFLICQSYLTPLIIRYYCRNYYYVLRGCVLVWYASYLAYSW